MWHCDYLIAGLNQIHQMIYVDLAKKLVCVDKSLKECFATR